MFTGLRVPWQWQKLGRNLARPWLKAEAVRQNPQYKTVNGKNFSSMYSKDA
jgi:hypothetical protein